MQASHEEALELVGNEAWDAQLLSWGPLALGPGQGSGQAQHAEGSASSRYTTNHALGALACTAGARMHRMPPHMVQSARAGWVRRCILPTWIPARVLAQVSRERAAARTLLAGLNPTRHVAGREHWLIVMAPDNLVAGEECVVLFNKRQSDALRCVCMSVCMCRCACVCVCWCASAQRCAGFECPPPPFAQKRSGCFYARACVCRCVHDS